MNIELCKKCNNICRLIYEDDEIAIKKDKIVDRMQYEQILECYDKDNILKSFNSAILNKKQRNMFIFNDNKNLHPIDLNKDYDKKILSTIKISKKCPYYAEHLIYDLNKGK